MAAPGPPRPEPQPACHRSEPQVAARCMNWAARVPSPRGKGPGPALELKGTPKPVPEPPLAGPPGPLTVPALFHRAGRNFSIRPKSTNRGKVIHSATLKLQTSAQPETPLAEYKDESYTGQN